MTSIHITKCQCTYCYWIQTYPFLRNNITHKRIKTFVLQTSYVQLYTLFLSYEYIILLSLKNIPSVTLITKPTWDSQWDSQVVAYLKLMEVYGRENDGGVFLWLVSNIKVSVTASCVIKKCRTDVFVSVFCNQRESMEFL